MPEAHDLLDAAAVGIYSIYDDGKIACANSWAARLLDRQRNELIGSNHHKIVGHAGPDGNMYSEIDCPLCAAARNKRLFEGRYDKFCRANGSVVPVEYTVAPWQSSDGRRSGSVITFRDVTEQQNLHLQLLRSQKLESIGQLAAGIAHEINTPIQYVGDNNRFLESAFHQLSTMLDAAAALVEDTTPGGPRPELLESLRQATRGAEWWYYRTEIPVAVSQSLDGISRVAAIVRAMKEFSHASPTAKSAVDLHHTIDNTVTISRNEWKYVANVVTEFDPALPHVTCLPGEISQVILNLVVNAAHAIGDSRKDSDEKGTITITTRHAVDHVEIRVKDSGTGIPQEIRNKIFDPFFTTKPVGKGTGQGLSLAYRIVVERHKGTIDFETEVGKGTTFVVRLPLDESLPEKHEEQREEAYSVC